VNGSAYELRTRKPGEPIQIVRSSRSVAAVFLDDFAGE